MIEVILENVEHLIQADVFYIHKVDHRNSSPKKSQWTISEESERECFSHSLISSWSDKEQAEYEYWGLHFDNEQVAYLGITRSSGGAQQEPLFIAKFLDSSQNNKWHGYPADYVKNNQDKPPSLVLKAWADAQHFSPATISKIAQSKPCKLRLS